MEVEVVSETRELVSLQEDWRRLEQGESFDTFFSGYHCVSAWWASFCADSAYELRIVVARQNGRMVGVLPLAIHRQVVHGEPYSVLRFASHGDVMGALVDPEGPEETICRALFRGATELQDWDQLYLSYVPFSSPLGRYLRRSEYQSQFIHVAEEPVVALSSGGGKDIRVPAKARNKRNKLFRERKLVFRIYQDDEAGIFDRLGRLHQLEKLHLREGGRDERHSWYDDALRVGHYRRLYSRPGTAITFTYETPDGELVGARSAFRLGRSLLSWTSAYHPDYEDYRLGKTLMLDVIEHLVEEGEIDRYDLGVGGYSWKFEWTDDCDHVYRLRVARKPRPKTRSRQARPATEVFSTPRGPTEPTLVPTTVLTRPWNRIPMLDDAPQRMARKVRRAQRGLLARISRSEVWYVVSPDDLVVQLGSRIKRAASERLAVVVLGHGHLPELVDQVNRDLAVPLTAHEVIGASQREAQEAAARLGIQPGRIVWAAHEDGSMPSLDELSGLVRDLAQVHRNALHVFPSLDACPPQFRKVVRAALIQAMKNGLAVVSLSRDSATAPAEGPLIAAADEFRFWDPDVGRYAVHRSVISRHLGLRTGGPRSHQGAGDGSRGRDT